ncbi:hypothetical protein N657DRAFT_636526 [Parathielavia appendiculata]|uniref:Uncharacterized protein n=1 Tax=Parathielavia appendiculata TaxID=2587402 RepID=A0AAN6TTP7_9PEZI|nr:hypothetical protein N657DRAFT_636526 [Parathielavia appendiculata]
MTLPGVRTRDTVLALMTQASEAEGDSDRAAERFPRYFNRVWDKQEITLARDAVIVCGLETCDAGAFHAAALFYGMLIVWEVNGWRAGRQTRFPGPFSELELRRAPGGPELTYLIARGHFNVLKSCRSRRVQPPTWVPKLNAKIAYTWSDELGVPLFTATGSRTQPTEPLNGSRPVSIRLRGARLDTITATGTVFVRHNEEKPYDQAAARQMFSEVEGFLGHSSIYTETERIDAIWRIPICDREYHPTSMYFRRATAELSGKQFVALRIQPLAGDVIAETIVPIDHGTLHGCGAADSLGNGPCWFGTARDSAR